MTTPHATYLFMRLFEIPLASASGFPHALVSLLIQKIGTITKKNTPTITSPFPNYTVSQRKPC